MYGAPICFQAGHNEISYISLHINLFYDKNVEMYCFHFSNGCQTLCHLKTELETARFFISTRELTKQVFLFHTYKTVYRKLYITCRQHLNYSLTYNMTYYSKIYIKIRNFLLLAQFFIKIS